jgi:hypothetical protein
MNRLLLVLLIISALSGCNWVQVTSEGAGVRLANARDINNCTRIGRTRAQTLSRIIVVERGGEQLQSELLRLARNEAGSMGGNTVVPESIIEEGRQTFGVYICPD